MKLDLPDDHPIAVAIHDATRQLRPGRMILSLDHFSHDGHQRLFSLDIDAWTICKSVEKHLELTLTDASERDKPIKALTTWPEMPSTDV